MVTIGRNAAVTHLLGRDLIGFRNHLLVMINWAWNYWFYK
jgi:hypothetical protein